MRIYVLDDEPIILRGSGKIIQQTYPEAEIKEFSRAVDLFDHVNKTQEYPDAVFSDIEMPGMTGLEFAVRFKKICPEAAIIFVTAYSQYALEAFRLHVHGYILKPLTADRVREELAHALQEKSEAVSEERLQTQHARPREQLRVQCFGYFEVFWKDVPLMFGRRQTKELLAYLIDRRGAACTAEEIALVLWEDEDNMKNLKARIRMLISDLRRVLTSIGMDDLIIRRSGQIAIRKEAIDCDYYRMLAGDMAAVNAFHGEYMIQYSWAEITAGRLAFDQ